ncbi:uncharacterized protein L201_001755 [Kwoniella dendrophila CBS 6074]|uniref:Uncharacterized protein n=1 Tax=Kwoniella dendrophila CBS 6074 TaxID=1295534 RepID=A0AAX4JN87_9TREE
MANPDAAAREALTIVGVLGVIFAFSIFSWAFKKKKSDDREKDRKKAIDEEKRREKKDREKRERDQEKDTKQREKDQKKKDRDAKRERERQARDNERSVDTPSSTQFDPTKPSDDHNNGNGNGNGGGGGGSIADPLLTNDNSSLTTRFRLAPDMNINISNSNTPYSVRYHDTPITGRSDYFGHASGLNGGRNEWYGDNGVSPIGPGGGDGRIRYIPETASVPIESNENGIRPPFSPFVLGTSKTPYEIDYLQEEQQHRVNDDHRPYLIRDVRTPLPIPSYQPHIIREPSLISNSPLSTTFSLTDTPITPESSYYDLRTSFLPENQFIDPYIFTSAKPNKIQFNPEELVSPGKIQIQEEEGIDLKPRRLSDLLGVPGISDTLGPESIKNDKYQQTFFGDLKQKNGFGQISPIDLNPVYITEDSEGERVHNLSPLNASRDEPHKLGEKAKQQSDKRPMREGRRWDEVKGKWVSPESVDLPTPVLVEEENKKLKQRNKVLIDDDEHEKAKSKARLKEREKIPISPERLKSKTGDKFKRMKKQRVKVLDRNTGKVKIEEMLVTDLSSSETEKLSPSRDRLKRRNKTSIGYSEDERESLHERERQKKKEKLRRKLKAGSDSEEDYISVDEDRNRIKKKKKNRLSISSEDERVSSRRKRRERGLISDDEEEESSKTRRKARSKREKVGGTRMSVSDDGQSEEERLYERYTDKQGKPRLRKLQHDDPYQASYRQRNRTRVGGAAVAGDDYDEEYELDRIQQGGQGQLRRRLQPPNGIYQDDGNLGYYGQNQYQQGLQQVDPNHDLARHRKLDQSFLEDEIQRENPSISRTEREELAKLRLQKYDNENKVAVEYEGRKLGRDQIAIDDDEEHEDHLGKKKKKTKKKIQEDDSSDKAHQKIQSDELEERHSTGPGQKMKLDAFSDNPEHPQITEPGIRAESNSSEIKHEIPLNHADRREKEEKEQKRKELEARFTRSVVPDAPSQKMQEQLARRHRVEADATSPVTGFEPRENAILDDTRSVVRTDSRRLNATVEDDDDSNIRKEPKSRKSDETYQKQKAEMYGQARKDEKYQLWENIISDEINLRMNDSAISRLDQEQIKVKSMRRWMKRKDRLVAEYPQVREEDLLRDTAQGVLRKYQLKAEQNLQPIEARHESIMNQLSSRPAITGSENSRPSRSQRDYAEYQNPSDTHHEYRDHQILREETKYKRERVDVENAADYEREILDLSDLTDKQVEEYEQTGKLPIKHQSDKASERKQRLVLSDRAYENDADHEEPGKPEMQMMSTRNDPIPHEDADIGAPDGISVKHANRRKQEMPLSDEPDSPIRDTESGRPLTPTNGKNNFDPNLYDDDPYEDGPLRNKPPFQPIAESGKPSPKHESLLEEVRTIEKPKIPHNTHKGKDNGKDGKDWSHIQMDLYESDDPVEPEYPNGPRRVPASNSGATSNESLPILKDKCPNDRRKIGQKRQDSGYASEDIYRDEIAEKPIPSRIPVNMKDGDETDIFEHTDDIKPLRHNKQVEPDKQVEFDTDRRTNLHLKSGKPPRVNIPLDGKNQGIDKAAEDSYKWPLGDGYHDDELDPIEDFRQNLIRQNERQPLHVHTAFMPDNENRRVEEIFSDNEQDDKDRARPKMTEPLRIRSDKKGMKPDRFQLRSPPTIGNKGGNLEMNRSDNEEMSDMRMMGHSGRRGISKKNRKLRDRNDKEETEHGGSQGYYGSDAEDDNTQSILRRARFNSEKQRTERRDRQMLESPVSPISPRSKAMEVTRPQRRAERAEKGLPVESDSPVSAISEDNVRDSTRKDTFRHQTRRGEKSRNNQERDREDDENDLHISQTRLRKRINDRVMNQKESGDDTDVDLLKGMKREPLEDKWESPNQSKREGIKNLRHTSRREKPELDSSDSEEDAGGRLRVNSPDTPQRALERTYAQEARYKAEESTRREEQKMEKREARSVENQEQQLNAPEGDKRSSDDGNQDFTQYHIGQMSKNPKLHLRAGWSIVKNAPIRSFFSTIGFVLYVEITRQIFSLLSISSGSFSTAVNLGKRALDTNELGFDIGITSNWFMNIFKSNQIESTSLFVMISLWNILCIPILGYLIYSILENQSNLQKRESTKSWILRKISGIGKSSIQIIFHDQNINSPKQMMKKFGLYTFSRLTIFVIQLIGTILIFRQTINLQYLASSAGSESFYSSNSIDLKITSTILKEFSENLSINQIFGITNFIFIILLLNLSISWYVFLHPKEISKNRSRSILKWLSISTIITTFIVFLIYFQEIANYLIRSHATSSLNDAANTLIQDDNGNGNNGSLVFVSANFMFMSLLPAMGYVAYELSNVYDKKFPNGLSSRKKNSNKEALEV